MNGRMRKVGGSKFVYCGELAIPDALELQEKLFAAQAEADELRSALWTPLVTVEPVEVCNRCESMRESLDELPALLSSIHEMSRDELMILSMFVDKMMGEGRDEYGELDIATDGRDLMAIASEVVGEAIDTAFYSLVRQLRIARGLK